ncbi:hypothetical protein ACLMJK_005818 [Lecanora helva]
MPIASPVMPSFDQQYNSHDIRHAKKHVERPDLQSPSNNWSHPGQAAFDFRSDYVTTPTISMLQSIVSTTLLDDVSMEDPTTNSFQCFIAELTGHENALLACSGTMSNQIALRTALTTPPYSILTDHRSHILTMEAGGAATLCGALIQGIIPSNGHHLTLADIQKHASTRYDIYDAPTAIISLENTLLGTIMPLSEIEAISSWAHSQSPPIHMHLDGARLWEVAVAGAGNLQDLCRYFDSVSLCFTKGLGAPIGSIVVGDSDFIHRARWVRKLLGGGLRQAGIITAPARVAVEEVFLGGKLKASQDTAKIVSRKWQSLGGRLARPTETNMVWLDMDDERVDKEAFWQVARDRGIMMHTKEKLRGRLVIHYQICDEAIEGMGEMMTAALS